VRQASGQAPERLDYHAVRKQYQPKFCANNHQPCRAKPAEQSRPTIQFPKRHTLESVAKLDWRYYLNNYRCIHQLGKNSGRRVARFFAVWRWLTILLVKTT